VGTSVIAGKYFIVKLLKDNIINIMKLINLGRQPPYKKYGGFFSIMISPYY